MTPPRRLELVVGGQTVRAELRESRRARRLRVLVRDGRPLEVTVPRGTRERTLRRFLDESADWIADRLGEARARAARTHTLGLARPGVAWVSGQPRPVPRLSSSDPAAALERWYRREARRLLEAAASTEAARLGVTYARIAVRDQRTRWGSCSTRGTLSFNWRLVLAPSEILEYVVVHELLHLREHNHSRAFWALLDLHRPSWRKQTEWLREHGAELQAYDPASAFGPVGLR